MTPVIASSLPILYVLLQWSALSRMRAGWRRAALFPVSVMALALAVTAIGIAANASIAPIAVVAGLPLATLYLLLLWSLHLVIRGFA